MWLSVCKKRTGYLDQSSWQKARQWAYCTATSTWVSHKITGTKIKMQESQGSRIKDCQVHNPGWNKEPFTSKRYLVALQTLVFLHFLYCCKAIPIFLGHPKLFQINWNGEILYSTIFSRTFVGKLVCWETCAKKLVIQPFHCVLFFSTSFWREALPVKTQIKPKG